MVGVISADGSKKLSLQTSYEVMPTQSKVSIISTRTYHFNAFRRQNPDCCWIRACTLTFYPFGSLEESCCFWRNKFQEYHKQISFRKGQWKLIRTELSEDTSFLSHVEFPGRSAFLHPVYYAAESVNPESCVWWSTTQVISWENAFCSHTLTAIYKFLSSAEYRDIYKTTGNWDGQPWIWYLLIAYQW